MENKKSHIFIYSVLFFLVMVVDQRLHTASVVASRTFVQALPLIFLIIVLLQFKITKIKRVYYYIYFLLVCMSTIGVAIFLFSREEFYIKYLLIIIEVAIYIFICWYIINNRLQYFRKEKFIQCKNILWIFILGLMCLSRYNGVWVYHTLALMILFFVVPIEKGERKRIVLGIRYGVMTSYLVFQGLAFMFRPYDAVRYLGLYNNPNMNALFYVLCLGAFLSNQMYLEEKGCKIIYKILHLILMGSIVSFTFFTGSKTAVLVEIALVILYICIYIIRSKRKVKALFLSVIQWILILVLTLPLCFLSVRYLPPIFHHPVWFYGEYSKAKVHSYDPIDSEKYVEYDELADLLLERYMGIDASQILEKIEKKKGSTSALEIETNEVELEPNKAQKATNEVLIATNGTKEQDELFEEDPNEGVRDGSSSENALYSMEDSNTSYTARINIWKQFLKQITLQGHRKEEGLFWLTEYYLVLHAHNLFLEFSYDFGIVTGVLFFIAYAIMAFMQFIKVCKTKSSEEFTILVFTIVLGLFGMVELSWYAGQASLTFFFFMICLSSREKDRGECINEK